MTARLYFCPKCFSLEPPILYTVKQPRKILLGKVHGIFSLIHIDHLVLCFKHFLLFQDHHILSKIITGLRILHDLKKIVFLYATSLPCKANHCIFRKLPPIYNVTKNTNFTVFVYFPFIAWEVISHLCSNLWGSFSLVVRSPTLLFIGNVTRRDEN